MDFPNIEQIRQEVIEAGYGEKEAVEDYFFAVHEFMRQPENIFDRAPYGLPMSADDVKTHFLWFKRSTRALPNPICDGYTYQDYLSSYYWRTLTLYYRTFVMDECADCGSTESLHLHHLTYEFPNGTKVFGKEFLYIKTDANVLETLCAKCHGKRHGIKRGNK